MDMERLKIPLEQLIYSEAAMLELLGIDKRTLYDLRREKDFPFVRLTVRAAVIVFRSLSLERS